MCSPVPKIRPDFIFVDLILDSRACVLVSSCFDTSEAMVPLLVPNISPWPVFVTEEDEELGILVVGCQQFRTLQTISYKWHLVSSTFSVTCLIPPCHHENRPTLHFQCKLQGWPVEANWPCPNSGRADPFAPILQIKDFSLSSVSGNLPTEKDCQLDQKWKTIQYFLSCSLEYLREAVHYRKVTKLWTFFVAFGGVFPHYKGDSNTTKLGTNFSSKRPI